MAVPTRPPTVSTPVPVPAVGVRRRRFFSLPETRWAATAVVFFVAGAGAHAAGGPDWLWWSLYSVCYAAGGWAPAVSGLRALREKTLDVDLLMVAAAIGAAAIGQVGDGALLIVIFATSGALEAFATARTEDSVRVLLDLAPDTATRVTGAGVEEVIAVTDLEIGDTVLVRPGERIAADATVVSGEGEVDQATVTGEPLPVDKKAGGEVFAGTLNGTGSLRIRVDRRAADSVVARIGALVEEASRTKARTQLFIEKVEQRYSLAMVVLTPVIFVVPLLFGDTVQRALLRAMTFMIVASPCAVVLATMPPLLAAVATAGRHGVLVKSAVVMEKLGSTEVLAFDKTGTLTRGTPEVAGLWCAPGVFDADELLRLAAAVERPSEHPLAAAIVRAARDRGLGLPAVQEFTAHPGRGVSALVDGRRVRVGAPAVLPTAADPGPAADAVATAVATVQAQGHTAVVVIGDRRPIGVLALADEVRAEAAAAVGAARRLTGAVPVLLTGDNRAAAERVAARVGIVDIRAGLLPADKVGAVRQLRAGGAGVTFVGDGINDAPALAAATAGIAMGGVGSDLTLRTADAVVVRDDLTAVPAVIALARRARRIVVANLVIAGSFIAVLVVWDLVGALPLPLGVAGHEGSTIIVGLNGLRLLRETAWRRAAAG